MIKYHIEIEDWELYDSEGGLRDYGTSLYVNEINITNYFKNDNVKNWEDLFKALELENTLITYKNK